MRISRRAIGIAGGASLLVLLGVAVAIATLDLNQLVAPVLARIKVVTGREVTVGGRVALRIGFVPRVVAEDVRVANAPWGTAPYLVTAKRLEMHVALLPLLRRHFELVRLRVVEPVVALETNKDGKGNWELAAAPGTGPAPEFDSRPGALLAGDLAVTGGTLTYRDAAGGETQVTIDELALRARDRQSQVEAEFKGSVDGTVVSLAGTLGPFATLLDPGVSYPVAVQGEVAGKKAALALKMTRGDKVVALQDIDAAFGSSNVKGKVDIRDADPRTLWTVNLTSTAFDLADLPAPRAAVAAAKPPTAAASHLVFSDAPVSFDVLRAHDANGEVTIDRLILPGGPALNRVHARFSVREGKLEAPVVQVAAYGGSLSAKVAVDATRGRAPAIALRLDGRSLDLAALLAMAGVAREVRGGKTSVDIDVTMRGDSLHQWMSGINGSARAVVGPATLVDTKLDTSLTFDALADAVNPFRKINPSTELQCAVIRLPLTAGVARVDRSIAIETREIDATMSGTLDFRNETLDLSIRPRVRQGIRIEIPQIAELVRFRGPFTAPTVNVDAMASATAIARIGAAISTGGLSVLGESILAQVGASTGTGACEVALGRAGSATASAAAEPAKSGAPTNPIEGIGNALKGLFKR